MKVLLLNGSPHQKGCTFTALSEVARMIEAAGIRTEIFWIGDQPVRDCIGCNQCSAAGAAGCVFPDKVYTGFIQKMHTADALIVGSPVYYAGPSGSLCSLLDRAFYSAKAEFERKPAACVVNCRRGGTSAAFDRLNKYFTISQMPVVSSRYWNDTHGLSPSEVSQDAEGMQTMRVLGQNMAALLQKISREETNPQSPAAPVRETPKTSLSIQTEVAGNPYFGKKLTKRAANFFWEKGFLIADCRETQEKDEYAIAKQLWKCHAAAGPLFKRLGQANADFDYALADLTPDDRNGVRNLCRSMRLHGWLTAEISPDGKSLKIRQPEPVKHRQFYNGGWAETVNRYLILKVLTDFRKQHRIQYKLLQNVKLRSDDPAGRHDMELDIVVDFGTRFYIFETKSGINLGLDKGYERFKMFTSGKDRFILCCTGDHDSRTFAPLRVIPLLQIETRLKKLLLKDFPDQP